MKQKKLRVLLATVMVLLMAVPIFAIFDDGPESIILIVEVNGEYRTTDKNFPDFGLVFDDTFTNGYPYTFTCFIPAPTYGGGNPSGSYTNLVLEYFRGSNTFGSTDWHVIDQITTNFFAHTNKVSAILNFANWIPPSATNTTGGDPQDEWYLIRIFAQTELGQENLDHEATNIDKDGDGITVDDEEVVLIRSVVNKRPGTE